MCMDMHGHFLANLPYLSLSLSLSVVRRTGKNVVSSLFQIPSKFPLRACAFVLAIISSAINEYHLQEPSVNFLILGLC
jgi:hypothetical protein